MAEPAIARSTSAAASVAPARVGVDLDLEGDIQLSRRGDPCLRNRAGAVEFRKSRGVRSVFPSGGNANICSHGGGSNVRTLWRDQASPRVRMAAQEKGSAGQHV